MAATLQHLGEEWWGDRLRRARRDVGDPGLREVADVVSTVQIVSHSTLARLEGEQFIPTDRKRRNTATLMVLAYGHEPADFGLDMAELPSAWTEERLSDLLRAAICWFLVGAGRGAA